MANVNSDLNKVYNKIESVENSLVKAGVDLAELKQSLKGVSEALYDTLEGQLTAIMGDLKSLLSDSQDSVSSIINVLDSFPLGELKDEGVSNDDNYFKDYTRKHTNNYQQEEDEYEYGHLGDDGSQIAKNINDLEMNELDNEFKSTYPDIKSESNIFKKLGERAEFNIDPFEQHDTSSSLTGAIDDLASKSSPNVNSLHSLKENTVSHRRSRQEERDEPKKATLSLSSIF